MELERQFLEVNNQRAQEIDEVRGNDEESRRRFAMERELWDGEKTDLQRKMRELNRKIEELQDENSLYQQQNQELKLDKDRINQDREEVRSAYRGILQAQQSDNAQDQNALRWRAKEELTRSYQEKERQLVEELRRKEERNAELYRQLRALKSYARELKYTAQDLVPIGQPLPEILTQPPPVNLDDEEADD